MLDIQSIAIVLTALSRSTPGASSTAVETTRPAIQAIAPLKATAALSKRDRLSAIGVPNRCGPKSCG
jgi:hypothetical protein